MEKPSTSFGMKKWLVVLIIFLISIPIVFADLPKDDTKETIYKTIYDGARPVNDKFAAKAAEKGKVAA